MNITELLLRTKYLLETDRVQRRWSDDELLLYLNDAQEYMRALKIEADPDYYLDHGTIADFGLTIAQNGSGLWELELPDFMEYIRRIEIFGNSVGGQGIGIEQTKLRDSHRSRTWSYFEGVYGTQNWLYVGPRRIAFTTQQASSTTELRIWFVRRVPRMARFTAQLLAGLDFFRVNVLSDNLIGTLSNRNDYYIDGEVEVVSAGNVAPEGEIRKVIAYSNTAAGYPNFDFQVSEAFSVAIDTGDIIEILPSVEVVHHELLCYLAAERALTKAGNVNQIAAMQQSKSELLSQYLTTANDRFDSTPDHVSWAGDDMR